jgi:hypothetical protein
VCAHDEQANWVGPGEGLASHGPIVVIARASQLRHRACLKSAGLGYAADR